MLQAAARKAFVQLPCWIPQSPDASIVLSFMFDLSRLLQKSFVVASCPFAMEAKSFVAAFTALSSHEPTQRSARWSNDPRPPRRAFTVQSRHGLYAGQPAYGLHVESQQKANSTICTLVRRPTVSTSSFDCSDHTAAMLSTAEEKSLFWDVPLHGNVSMFAEGHWCSVERFSKSVTGDWRHQSVCHAPQHVRGACAKCWSGRFLQSCELCCRKDASSSQDRPSDQLLLPLCSEGTFHVSNVSLQEASNSPRATSLFVALTL